MDDPRVVGRLNGPGQRDQQLGGLPAGLGRAVQAIGQRSPLQELERHEGQVVDLADLVDLNDVGMAELGDGLGLGAKAGEVLGACLLPAADHLHRDHAVQTGLAGQVNHPHAPFAELFQELVAGNRGPVGGAVGLVAVLGGRVVLTTPAHRAVGILYALVRGRVLHPKRRCSSR